MGSFFLYSYFFTYLRVKIMLSDFERRKNMNRNVMIKQGWVLPEEDKLELIIKDVHELPIELVLQKYGVEPVRYVGSRILSLCPFHMDENIGSFSIDTEKKMCWCFACNNGGDAINSMKKIWNRSYVETVLQIACDFNLIDAKTYSELLGTEYERQGNEIKVKRERSKKRPSLETLTMWTKVYEFIANWFGLSDEDRDVLTNVRKLTEDRLHNYFSFSTKDTKTVSRLIFDLKSAFPEYADKLVDIPGFFEAKYKDRWQLTMFEYDAIGILLRNTAGLVVGIQLRDKDENAKVRYKYLSFKANSKNKYLKGGNTVGTPIDVIIPDNNNGKVAIVEGRFKAEILAQQGFIAMSVQGVNNFSGIEKDIKEVEAKLNMFIKKVYVFYDADQLRNGAVYQAGIKLGKYVIEKAKKNVSYAIWDQNFGKGIDDLILNGNKLKVKTFSFETYENTFNKAYAYAEEKSGIKGKTIISLKKEDRTAFYDAFESMSRKQFNV